MSTLLAPRGRAEPAVDLRVGVVHRGPATHGVTRFGLELARALAAGGVVVREEWVDRTLPASADAAIVHLQFSDSLWGDDTGRARVAVLDAVAALRDRGAARTVVTLHDLPDPDDEPGRWARRARTYRDVARAADRVVVSADHEQRRLATTGAGVVATVVPNPVPVLPAVDEVAVRRRRAWLGRHLGAGPIVGLLGWIHPGKGGEDVLRALSGTGACVALLGSASPGQEDHLVRLRALARRLEVPLVATGWLDDHAQVAAMRAVDHAVVAHPAPSTSGSMTAWIAAGIVPWVQASAYARELAARDPGALRLHDGDVAGVLDTPGHHDPGGGAAAAVHHLRDELSPATAAGRHLAVYAP